MVICSINTFQKHFGGDKLNFFSLEMTENEKSFHVYHKLSLSFYLLSVSVSVFVSLWIYDISHYPLIRHYFILCRILCLCEPVTVPQTQLPHRAVVVKMGKTTMLGATLGCPLGRKAKYQQTSFKMALEPGHDM